MLTIPNQDQDTVSVVFFILNWKHIIIIIIIIEEGILKSIQYIREVVQNKTFLREEKIRLRI